MKLHTIWTAQQERKAVHQQWSLNMVHCIAMHRTRMLNTAQDGMQAKDPPRVVPVPGSKGTAKSSDNQEVLNPRWVVMRDEGSPVQVHDVGVMQQLQGGSFVLQGSRRRLLEHCPRPHRVHQVYDAAMHSSS